MPVAKKVDGYHAHLTPSTENALKNLPPFSYENERSCNEPNV